MKSLSLAAIAAVCTLASGCASIISGSNQSLSVETRHKGEPVSSASCKLTNNKGTWFVTTPGSVTVNRSYEEMVVRCDKDGLEAGISHVKSSTKALAFGNIIIGGIVGVGVDVATGAAYDYPSLFTIEMGQVALQSQPVPETAAANGAYVYPCAVKQGPGCTN